MSNGHPITGRLYAETLGAYYASLKSLDFKWDRWEVISLGDHAAVFTGWASAKTVDLKGNSEAGRALFTMVFADDGSGWKRVIAQKWQSPVPAVSAAHPAAPVDRVPAASGIAVHFNESVTVTASTFHLECPAGTPVAMTLIRALQSQRHAEECARIMSGTDPWITLGRGYDARGRAGRRRWPTHRHAQRLPEQ